MRKILLLIIVFICTTQEDVTAQYWSAVGKGIGPLYTYNYCDGGCDGQDAPMTGPPIAAMCMYNGELYAAGYFDYLTDANGHVNNIAKWNGTNWSGVGSGVYTVGGGGYDSWIYALVVYKGELYAGGYFTDVGGVEVNNIAKWDGTKWSAVGKGLGSFGYSVSSLVVYNEELYAGGYFYNSGNLSVHNIAKWDGTNWSALGTGIEVYKNEYFNGTVSSLTVHDGVLYAGGHFDSAGSIAAKNIARWNGTNWSAVGEGIDSAVSSLISYNGELYAGVLYNNIKNWDGAVWSSLTPGINWTVYSFAIYNNDLIAAGYFDTTGNVPQNIAKWNGVSWSAMGNGISSGVRCLITHNDILYAGGDFSTAGNVVANRIAAWREQCCSVPEQPGNIIKWTTACQNSYAVFYIDPVTNAADFTWSLPQGWSGNSISNRITVLAGTGSGTISVIANNPCGSSNAQTLQVSALNRVPLQLDSITGNKTTCKDSYQTYSVNPVPEATSYSWILPSDWSGSSITNTINVKTGANGGTISVRARNSCSESNAQIIDVVIKDLPISIPDIKGNTIVPAGSTQQYSIDTIPGAPGYSWYLDNGGSISSGQNSNSITINWKDPGNYFLSVKVTNNCVLDSEKKITITVVENGNNDPYELKILPNPSSGKFYLKVKGAQDKMIKLEIVNMLSQVVLKTQSPGSNNYIQQLDLQKLSPGVYAARIIIDNKIYTRIIVKK